MALQLGAIRDALLDAGASPDKADKAAEELAAYETRFTSIENELSRIVGKLSLLTWAVGINVAATVAIFSILYSLSSRLGEINGQLTQIAQLLHH